MGARAQRFHWWLQPRLVPRLRNSQFAYVRLLRQFLNPARRWLDLGCGHAWLPDWMPEPLLRLPLDGRVVVGIDRDAQALVRHERLKLRVRGNAECLPFQSAVFDLVTANMTLEHIEHPGALFRDAQRVLMRGGHCVVHTPNVYGYTTALARLLPHAWRVRLAKTLQGREASDIYPTYYQANTVTTLDRLAREAGLQPVGIELVLSSPQLAAIPPLLIPELLWLRLLRGDWLRSLRPCLVAVFRKD